jgi:hypothetical protein
MHLRLDPKVSIPALANESSAGAFGLNFPISRNGHFSSKMAKNSHFLVIFANFRPKTQ